MKKKIIALVGALFALLLSLTACSQDLMATGANPSPSASAAAPTTFTTEQELAADACLTPAEHKALKAEGDTTTKNLLAKCKEVGKTVFDGLNKANKDKKITADYAAELASTNSLMRATFVVTYLKGVKEVQANGVAASDTQQLAAQIKALLPNANKDDVLAGSEGINLAAHTIEKGGDVFLSGADRYLKTKADIAAFLNDTKDPAAVAAKDHVTKAVVAAGGEKERIRALTGEGYIPIQLKGASQIMGTSYFQNGQVKILDQWRQSLAGDVYWLYVTTDMKLVPEATLRADCGNMEAKVIRIIKPGIPPAPGVNQPPGKESCPPGTVMQPNGECHTPPPPPAVCPPGTTGTPPNCIEVKNPALDPAPQGNAGNGGGKNADPGPGTYVPPNQMQQPPSTPYVPPAPPAPKPAPVTQPAPGGGTVVIPAPNPNPAGPRYTAPPEPAAPAPSKAPDTCVPAPGKTSC